MSTKKINIYKQHKDNTKKEWETFHTEWRKIISCNFRDRGWMGTKLTQISVWDCGTIRGLGQKMKTRPAKSSLLCIVSPYPKQNNFPTNKVKYQLVVKD